MARQRVTTVDEAVPLSEGRPPELWWQLLLPPSVASVALLALVRGVWQSMLYYASGHFAYALDDAYIHMALAKNLVKYGVFGATRFEFTSSSSSPMWTLLLALWFKLTGIHDLTALVLAAASAIGVLVCADYVMRKLGVRVAWRLVALLWLCVSIPLFALVFTGMEAPLQILADVAFLYVASLLIERDVVAWDRMAWVTLVLAAAATAVRYEGVLIVAIVAVLLAARRRWNVAAAVVGAAALPIVAYGVVSVSHGAFFLPNSVLVKSSSNLASVMISKGLGAFASAVAAQTATAYPVYLLLATAIVLLVLQLRSGISTSSASVVFPAVSSAVALVQLTLGQVGWFYRYDAYLIALLGISVVIQLTSLRAGLLRGRGLWAVATGFALLLAAASVGVGLNRGWQGWQATPRATENVYEQMYQTAQFLKANPQYDSVAVGDLGAVAYYNDNLRILDLEGLAETGEPLASLGRYRSTAADIAARAQKDGIKIAIVFPDYFHLPRDWTEVARWTISNNIVAYADTVAFLAVPPTDPAKLAANVHRYTVERLPKTVGARGVPIEATP